MAMAVALPGNLPCKFIKWKVKKGYRVSQATILALYKAVDSDSIQKLKCNHMGTVTEVLVSEGQTVQPGDVLLKLEGCKHPTVMKDMCADCGADLRQERESTGGTKKSTCASVAMVHSIPELIVSEEQALELGRQDELRLLNHRKLVLLVDLDQTLLHTTNDNIPPNLKDVEHFRLWHGRWTWYHTKFRPGTRKFLEEMSKLYELHICTFGVRMYAHTIAGILDTAGKYFSHRILSRDECFSANSKTANLKALFPCGDSMVCIIDDRDDVWKFAPNLVHVKPYLFFDGTADINAPPGANKTQDATNHAPRHNVKVIRVPRKRALDDSLEEDQKDQEVKCQTDEHPAINEQSEEKCSKGQGKGSAEQVKGQFSGEAEVRNDRTLVEEDKVKDCTMEVTDDTIIGKDNAVCGQIEEGLPNKETKSDDIDQDTKNNKDEDRDKSVERDKDTEKSKDEDKDKVSGSDGKSTVEDKQDKDEDRDRSVETDKDTEKSKDVDKDKVNGSDGKSTVEDMDTGVHMDNTNPKTEIAQETNCTTTETHPDVEDVDSSSNVQLPSTSECNMPLYISQSDSVLSKTETHSQDLSANDQGLVKEITAADNNAKIEDENIKITMETVTQKQDPTGSEAECMADLELSDSDDSESGKGQDCSEINGITSKGTAWDGTAENDENNKVEKEEGEVTSDDDKADSQRGVQGPPVEYDEIIEWEDTDDYLIYLEDILRRIHTAYYEIYDQEKQKSSGKIPDLKSIIPYIKKKVLKGANILFSGVIPTNQPPEKSRAYQAAKSLGANIQTSLVPKNGKNGEEATTHLVAAKTGTAKVHQAKKLKNVHTVNPDWLWTCLERWEWVDERIFPLTDQSSFPYADSPEPWKPKKKGKKGASNSEGKKAEGTPTKQAGSRKERKFSDSYNPLFAFSSSDIKEMDREVEEIFDESESEDSEAELRRVVLGFGKKRLREESSSEESLSAEYPKGWKKKSKRCHEGPRACDNATEEEEEEDDENEERRKIIENPNRVMKFSDQSNNSSSSFNESIGSVDEEMAAALEREFLSF